MNNKRKQRESVSINVIVAATLMPLSYRYRCNYNKLPALIIIDYKLLK